MTKHSKYKNRRYYEELGWAAFRMGIALYNNPFKEFPQRAWWDKGYRTARFQFNLKRQKAILQMPELTNDYVTLAEFLIFNPNATDKLYHELLNQVKEDIGKDEEGEVLYVSVKQLKLLEQKYGLREPYLTHTDKQLLENNGLIH